MSELAQLPRPADVPFRERVAPWVPAAFCAFLCVMPLFTPASGDSGWWRPAFFSFLPMCFYFVGAVVAGLQGEVRALRRELAASRGSCRPNPRLGQVMAAHDLSR